MSFWFGITFALDWSQDPVQIQFITKQLQIISCACNDRQALHCPKNLGRLWFAYRELQGAFSCHNSYLLTLGTLHSQNSDPYKYQVRMWAFSNTIRQWKGSWAFVGWMCPTFLAYHNSVLSLLALNQVHFLHCTWSWMGSILWTFWLH